MTDEDFLDDWSDTLDEREYPEPDDDDDDSETVPCPECGADVYELSPQCPTCGQYITHTTNPRQGRSCWWIVLGLLGIFATIAWLIQ